MSELTGRYLRIWDGARANMAVAHTCDLVKPSRTTWVSAYLPDVPLLGRNAATSVKASHTACPRARARHVLGLCSFVSG